MCEKERLLTVLRLPCGPRVKDQKFTLNWTSREFLVSLKGVVSIDLWGLKSGLRNKREEMK